MAALQVARQAVTDAGWSQADLKESALVVGTSRGNAAGWLGPWVGLEATLLVLSLVAGGAVLMSARLWPGEEAGAVSHEHPDLPPDHPHLQAHGGARHHSHEIIIDDEHLHWPARG